MTRILVADDNSNIQRMVTLALKGEGIEVVAVGNGEAAVRKLPDGTFDLVLADIFMPVRSGYEVCDFIKRDPRYSQIPVVLFVGAFDPLDEAEAQRVSADGILKKPFVPPDPLIGMVKGLLAKSAKERPVAAAVPVAVSSNRTPKATDKEFPAPHGETSTAASGTQIAVSELLEMPVADDADLVMTSHRDPSLGEPAWNHPIEILGLPSIEGDEAPSNDGLNSGIQDHTWSNPSPLGMSELLPPIESAAIEIPVVNVEASTEQHPALEDLFAQDAINALREEMPAPKLFAADSVEAPAAPSDEIELPLAQSESEAESDASVQQELTHQEQPQHETQAAPQELAVQQEISADPEVMIDREVEINTEAAADNNVVPLETPPVWETEGLAQTSVIQDTHVTVETAQATPQIDEATDVANQDVARQDDLAAYGSVASELSSEVDQELAHSPMTDSRPEPHPYQNGSAVTTIWPPPFEPVVSPPPADPLPAKSAPDPELIEAVVERVVARLQPKAFDVVTREILRPLVDAMVRRELENLK